MQISAFVHSGFLEELGFIFFFFLFVYAQV